MRRWARAPAVTVESGTSVTAVVGEPVPAFGGADDDAAHVLARHYVSRREGVDCVHLEPLVSRDKVREGEQRGGQQQVLRAQAEALAARKRERHVGCVNQ